MFLMGSKAKSNFEGAAAYVIMHSVKW